MLWQRCDYDVVNSQHVTTQTQHKHNFNFFANFLISNATDATDDDVVINDVINTFLEYTIRLHHGRRHQLIRRQSRRVTPMILYPGRAHRLYFQYWPFVYFFCGWFVGGKPPTHRAVLPVLRITPLLSTSNVGQMKQQRVKFAVETTPPECLFDHSTIFDYSLFFLRLFLYRGSSSSCCISIILQQSTTFVGRIKQWNAEFSAEVSLPG